MLDFLLPYQRWMVGPGQVLNLLLLNASMCNNQPHLAERTDLIILAVIFLLGTHKKKKKKKKHVLMSSYIMDERVQYVSPYITFMVALS